MSETAAPQWPRVGASAAIFRGDTVLLVERGKGAWAGRWSLPGGHIEPGERAAAAALREIREETGVEARIMAVLDVHDVIAHGSDGALRTHYVLAVFAGVWAAGEPRGASDVRAARFVAVSEIGALPLTEGAEALIRRAHALVQVPASG